MTTKVEATRFEKAVASAFKYFPFGMNNPVRVDGWVASPVFCVREPGSQYDEAVIVSLLGPNRPQYTEYQDWSKRVEEHITKRIPKLKLAATIAATKHSDRCTARVVDWGTGSAELVYPLVRLLNAVGATRYTSDGDFTIGGWKGDECVAVISARKGCDAKTLKPPKAKPHVALG